MQSNQIVPIAMLVASNFFMTYAWYGHLKDLRAKPLLLVIVLSWCVAFFEYCLMVPANRMGIQLFSLPQLKVLQVIITMCVFALFCIPYMKERISIDFLWAGLCLIGAAFFMFRQMQHLPSWGASEMDERIKFISATMRSFVALRMTVGATGRSPLHYI